MSIKQESVTLRDSDLSDTDREVLNVLEEGRVTPQYLADQLGISRQYASDRLKRYREHGVVTKLASGLYEFNTCADPRNNK